MRDGRMRLRCGRVQKTNPLCEWVRRSRHLPLPHLCTVVHFRPTQERKGGCALGAPRAVRASDATGAAANDVRARASRRAGGAGSEGRDAAWRSRRGVASPRSRGHLCRRRRRRWPSRRTSSSPSTAAAQESAHHQPPPRPRTTSRTNATSSLPSCPTNSAGTVQHLEEHTPPSHKGYFLDPLRPLCQGQAGLSLSLLAPQEVPISPTRDSSGLSTPWVLEVPPLNL